MQGYLKRLHFLHLPKIPTLFFLLIIINTYLKLLEI
jgi:hypothetical protein